MPKVGAPKTAHASPWATKLLGYLKDPALNPSTEYFDDNFVVIRDAFPKARQHYLLLPRKRIELNQLTKSDIPMLEAMVEIQDKFLQGKTEKFRVGFHSVPSMAQLHLHMITDDFCSSALKTKKHYLSFTTRFFMPIEEVLDSLQSGTFSPTVLHSRLDLLKGKLECIHCSQILSNIPKLKDHLEQHTLKRVQG